MSREYVMFRVRTALSRIHGQAPPPLGPPMLTVGEVDRETRIIQFIRQFENLAGKAFRVPDLDGARTCVENLLDIPSAVILTDLDELLTVLPKPAEQTSSMVLISGPSRTADIEQILVRGVHGPGEIRVIIVDT